MRIQATSSHRKCISTIGSASDTEQAVHALALWSKRRCIVAVDLGRGGCNPSNPSSRSAHEQAPPCIDLTLSGRYNQPPQCSDTVMKQPETVILSVLLKGIYPHKRSEAKLYILRNESGVDPRGVLWVLKHPPSGLRYMYNIIYTASQLLTVVVYTVLMYTTS